MCILTYVYVHYIRVSVGVPVLWDVKKKASPQVRPREDTDKLLQFERARCGLIEQLLRLQLESYITTHLRPLCVPAQRGTTPTAAAVNIEPTQVLLLHRVIGNVLNQQNPSIFVPAGYRQFIPRRTVRHLRDSGAKPGNPKVIQKSSGGHHGQAVNQHGNDASQVNVATSQPPQQGQVQHLNHPPVQVSTLGSVRGALGQPHHAHTHTQAPRQVYAQPETPLVSSRARGQAAQLHGSVSQTHAHAYQTQARHAKQQSQMPR